MKSVLAIIDVQKYFINEYTQPLPGKIARFLEKNANKFDHIIFFKFQNSHKANWFKIIGWENMVNEKETEIAPELAHFTTDALVFTKVGAFSIFRVNNFISLLKNEKIQMTYICGTDTDACIYVSVMEAFERGYEIKLIEDLTSTHHGSNYHKNAIDAIKKNLSEKVLITSDSFKTELV